MSLRLNLGPARRAGLAGLVVLTGLLVLVVAAWAADSARYDGRVHRNVALAGEDVGGMNEDELREVVRRLAARYAEAPVQVEAPGGGFSTDSASLGLKLEEDATVQAVMDVGRTGNLVGRVRGWVGSFAGKRRAPVRVMADPPAVYRVVARLDPGPRTPAQEPSLRAVGEGLEPVEGKPGHGIDAGEVLRVLPRAARRGVPIVVRVDRGDVAPRFSVADAERLAVEGEQLTEAGLEVAAGSQQGTVPPGSLRSWLRTEATDAGLRLSVDPKAAATGLGKLFPTPETPAKDAMFTVVGGSVRIVGGEPGRACCGPGAGDLVAAAVRERRRDRVELPLKRLEPKRTAEEAASLGIKEQVATFTTNHAPGQPRVSNIHKIADMLKGRVIEPGQTFSVNEAVGRRTVEKGFVVDKVIEDGKFEEEVGGGISQFATTLFNAAFFAGLEFPEYQSHSIYISRYPFGREATLSYPRPDLKLRNPSPHGVLVWPTYTGRSITVTLYSTRWVEAAQTEQTKEPRGSCTRVRTTRTRKLLSDGSVKVDHVNAVYRAAEGVDCDDPAPPPPGAAAPPTPTTTRR